MLVGVLLSSSAERAEEVQVRVSSSSAVPSIVWRGVTVRGVVQPHSRVAVFELGQWREALTEAELLILPPALSSKLLVLPVILVAATRGADGVSWTAGELRVSTYLSWLHEGNCALGLLYRRMARMSLHPAGGSMEELVRLKKRGAAVRVKPAAARGGKRKAKSKEVSEDSDECQDDACEEEEDEDEEEEGGDEEEEEEGGDEDEELNDEVDDGLDDGEEGDECDDGGDEGESEESEEEDEDRDLLSSGAEDDDAADSSGAKDKVVKKGGGGGRRKKARVDGGV